MSRSFLQPSFRIDSRRDTLRRSAPTLIAWGVIIKVLEAVFVLASIYVLNADHTAA